MEEGQEGYAQNNRDITVSRDVNFTDDYVFEIASKDVTFGGSFISNSSGEDFRDAILNFDGNNVFGFSFIVVNGGNLVLNEKLVIKNNIAENGSAVCVYNGTLAISGAEICENGEIGGVTAKSINGGAIFSQDSTITISSGLIYNNQATNGGAIHLSGYGLLEINENEGNVYIYSNIATFGGAIYIDSSIQDESMAVEISSAEIFSNSATEGGAIYINDGFVKLINETSIYSNVATNGGAISVMNGILIVDNAIIGTKSRSQKQNDVGLFVVGNIATNNGGGIYVGASGILKWQMQIQPFLATPQRMVETFTLLQQ